MVLGCQKVVDYQQITRKSVVIIIHFHCEPFSSQQLARYCGFQQVAATCNGDGNYVTGPLDTEFMVVHFVEKLVCNLLLGVVFHEGPRQVCQGLQPFYKAVSLISTAAAPCMDLGLISGRKIPQLKK